MITKHGIASTLIVGLTASVLATGARCDDWASAESGYQAILAKLSDSSSQKAKSLCDTRKKQSATALIDALDSPQAYCAIGKLNFMGSAAVSDLIKGLSRRSPVVRSRIVTVLGMIKDPAAVPALGGLVKNYDESPSNKILAFQTVADIDRNAAVKLIAPMAADRSDSVRDVAAVNARSFRRKEMIPILIGLLTDPQLFVAGSAASSLGALTGRTAKGQDWESCVDFSGGIVPEEPVTPSTPERILPSYQLPEVKCLETRTAWAKNWSDWWKTAEPDFQFLPTNPRSRA